MAVGLTHAKSTVHIGDGFKFLNDYKNAFDVIITDSSDPDGPAASLFEKSYFQLLHDALREGGVITTQGCMSPIFLRKVDGPWVKGRCVGSRASLQRDSTQECHDLSNWCQPVPSPILGTAQS